MRYKFCDYENETNRMQCETYTVHITNAIIILFQKYRVSRKLRKHRNCLDNYENIVYRKASHKI